MTKCEIIRILRGLNIPTDKYIVTMGSVLAINGIRKASDIDIIYDKEIEPLLVGRGFKYESNSSDSKYKNRYVLGSVEAFDNFYNIGTFSECLKKYKKYTVSGIPFMQLEDIYDIKKIFAREKDFKDLEMVV